MWHFEKTKMSGGFQNKWIRQGRGSFPAASLLFPFRVSLKCGGSSSPGIQLLCQEVQGVLASQLGFRCLPCVLIAAVAMAAPWHFLSAPLCSVSDVTISVTVVFSSPEVDIRLSVSHTWGS